MRRVFVDLYAVSTAELESALIRLPLYVDVALHIKRVVASGAKLGSATDR